MATRLLPLSALLLVACAAGRRRGEADHYFDQQRYPAAARAYGDVLARRPEDARALLGQARAYLAADRPEEALPAAQAAAGLGLPEGTALYAEALLRTGAAEQALALLGDPGAVPGGQRLLAEARLSTGDLGGALAAALETTDRGLLAWCALRTGDRSAARSAAEVIYTQPPDDTTQHAELAGVLLSLGLDAEVTVADEHVTRWWDDAARRQAAGDDEGTLRLLSRLAVSRPDEPQYSETLGRLWLATGEPELARRALEDALSIDPARPEAWVALAASCAAIRKPDCEAAAWEGRLSHGPPLEDSWLLAGRAWEEAGDLPRRLALWERANRVHPTDPVFTLELARALRAAGDLDRAIGYAERSWALAPADAERAVFLAQLFMERGDKPAAARVYEAGRRAHPEDVRFSAGLRAALGYVP